MLFLSPVCNDQTFDANGDPLNGGEIETYLAGSSTPAATYTDDTGVTPHSNPIVLNSLGYPTAGPIWLTGGIAYKFIIKNAAGSTLRTIDDISGINDASVSQSEWVESGLVPTYIGATSFSVPGDQTAILQINRRTRTTNTSGFVYSTISNSVFAAGITTVTLANDSGTLDAGLSLVAYGLLSADDPSIPELPVPVSRLTGQVTIANGGTGESTAAAAFAALKQAATDSATGVVELATDVEAQAGTSTVVVLTPANMKAAQIQLGTAVTLTTQTAVDYTGIPSWAKRVKIKFFGVEGSGTSNLLVQIGDAGGMEVTGYVSTTLRASSAAGGPASSTSGFIIQKDAASFTLSGMMELEKFDSGNVWISTHSGKLNTAQIVSGAGDKTLSDTLTQVRITTVNGTDLLDLGQVNISWE